MLQQTLKRIRWISEINSILKSKTQEWQARSTIEAYKQELAAKQPVVATEPKAVKFALRERIAQRRKGRQVIPLGEMHIFLAYYVSNWEAILPQALKPFGKVSQFEWRSEGFDDTQSDWLSRRDDMNCEMLKAFNHANSVQPVDAVVGYLSGHNIAPEILQKMARSGAAIFNFCWDDKLNFPGKMLGGRYTSPASIAHAIDLNLTNAPESVIKYAAHGGLAMFWPEAAHPDLHRPYDIPFEFDVSFVGACYGWRPRFIRKLGKLGVKVECFGKGWPNGSLSDEEMIRLYSRSRINLGSGGVGHSRKLLCLKGRDFEVPMSGGLYLTQYNPELELVFNIGREIITYVDTSDCARKVGELLADPERCMTIRRAARERSLQDHTYLRRYKELFQMAGLLKE